MISTVSARVSRDVAPKEIRASFEFFPPKSPEAETALWTTIRRIEPLDPAFVSVTYGAGGTTRERTLDTVTRLCRETTLKPAAHFTCVGASKADINSTLEAFIVQQHTFAQVGLELLCGPAAELRATVRLHAVTNGQCHLQVVVLEAATDLPPTLLPNL